MGLLCLFLSANQVLASTQCCLSFEQVEEHKFEMLHHELVGVVCSKRQVLKGDLTWETNEEELGHSKTVGKNIFR